MLAPETGKVWDILQAEPLLDGFVLVGGTALSLQINHRISEDLDFAYTEPFLPKSRLQRLLQLAPTLGLFLERNDDPAALRDFLMAGLDLWDAQQDLIANGAVKISFFVPSRPQMNVIGHYGRPGGPVVATVDELFASKALVAADRSKSRDWFDLYILMTRHGYSADDFTRAFFDNDARMQLDTALTRLCVTQPGPDDESYLPVVDNPPNLEQLQTFFKALRDEVEISLASRSPR